MSNKLFFLTNGRALKMEESLYESEDLLQKLIEENPQLLASGSETLLLVSREYAICEEEGSGNSYSLDHLFVDQDAVPVLVEVKRSSDTRIKREVVAQMLDYASRASRWNAGELRELFRKNNPVGELRELYDTDDFWDRVDSNLKAEKLKLVFAADSIPTTLRTLIDFLNRTMSGIELYGVEVHRYKTEDATLLASGVVCEKQKEPSKQTVRSSGERWTIERFSEYLASKGIPEVAPVLRSLMDFADSSSLSYSFGSGVKNPTIAFTSNGYELFRLTGWSKRAVGELCTIEFCIRELAQLQSRTGLGESILREMFFNLPNVQQDNSGLAWNTNDYLYIDIHMLLDESNFAFFRDSVRKLSNAVNAI